VRQLKGLEDFISVSVVDHYLDDKGWKFTTPDKVPGTTPDEVNHASRLREIYYKASPSYDARFTVPVLWDKKNNTIVSNESSEIIRMFYHSFNHLIAPEYQKVELLPQAQLAEIDELNSWIYEYINNGVYRCGFATTQEAYESNVFKLFEHLDKVEKVIAANGGPYVLGKQLTEVDVRLYTTIIRFDPVYVQHFKCNIAMIRYDYPHLHKWLRNLYWNHPAFKDTTDFEHIKFHYTKSHLKYNPFGITAAGPLPHIKPLDA
jgi:glutathionyl-hydroquinone reductase